MKILICSHLFAPSVGGTETVGRLLAEEFRAVGDEVRIATETSGESNYAFPIIRKPSPGQLLDLCRWADVVFHNNISLRAAWPLLFERKPWIITHHTWIPENGIAAWLKRHLLGCASNISISSAIARTLPVASRIIPDPYEANTFYPRRQVLRDRDLVFVGRLVSDKGCSVLLDAMDSIGKNVTLTIVGDGPERKALESRADRRVRFTGTVTGEALAKILNQHRILVVPSLWNEPFGVVALEAIACGCAVIGSGGGGLPEAIGKCGRLFENGNAAQLAAVIREMLASDVSVYTRHAEAHLKLHHPEVIAQKYLEVFQRTR